jgi:5-oxoprolinase (ATP-hydrolysing)
MQTLQNRWSFWIDRGGTFTDIVAVDPDGALRTHKLLSRSPAYRDPAVAGIKALMGGRLDPDRIAAVHLGTTVATNALLERKGARVALITTKGFRDQLRIGVQARPKLFVRQIVLPERLYERVIEVEERVSAQGEVLTPLALDAALPRMRQAVADGLTSAAVVFLHGYRFPAHEMAAAQAARAAGFAHVSAGHVVSPLMKYVPRAGTAVADAYLAPVLDAYVGELAAELGPIARDGRLKFMRSDGGLSAAGHFRATDAILSGPAGGVVGQAKAAAASGRARSIGFDMGGTSTDVSRFDGDFERVSEAQIAGVRLRVPMLAIHTVAAGGGSILALENGRMRAGPESAGSDPGPACYRRGGPLTVTDANVMTGRLAPEFFPAIFGPGADAPLDAAIVASRFAALALTAGKTPVALADGFLDIAVANMAEAIKRVSVQRGYDVRDYVLNAFGGAGGQLACRVADALGMREVMVHPLASLLSAYGIGIAGIRVSRDFAVEDAVSQTLLDGLRGPVMEMRRQAEAEVLAQGAASVASAAIGALRYAGSDAPLPVPLGDLADMRAAFAEAHRRRFGFWAEDRALILESVTVEANGAPHGPAGLVRGGGGAGATPDGRTRIFAGGAWREAAVVSKAAMTRDRTVPGPALIVEPYCTIVVEEGWQAALDAQDALFLTRTGMAEARVRSTDRDPVMLEIANARFMSIAEQMGAVLEKTASSVNIKERLDFSCAIFNPAGELIANAPHMPVHLGSMGDSVLAILRRHRDDMRDGDAFALNAPYDGGTHLPDVTVVTPVFVEGVLRFFTAARGHHADIGSVTPGSMPPGSRTIEEEGVVLDGRRIVRAGVLDQPGLRAALASGPYPARDPDRNIADLAAQIAACAKGAEELRALCAEWGAPVVTAYMGHVLDDAEERTREVIGRMKDGAFRHEMDDGATIAVAISVNRQDRTAIVDFTGTSAQRPNNFNAPRPVTQAAVLYAFRCLVDSEIPLNAGCMRPLTIVAPEGSMLNPVSPAAVVAGNVETSQAVTDAMFAAMGVMAAAQGTMNNLTFGDERFQYYETICGGAGAGPDWDGASAVHTHMTNSRLTDPEVLEWRFPVLLRRFEIRGGSGGGGARRGGDGVVREIAFREPMDVSILSTRRRTRPFGLNGGGDGAPGRNAVRRADGSVEELPGCARAAVGAGDAIVIETPGGGGFGRAD